MSTVGTWLKQQRESLGWSQTDLSWEARVAATQISQFERGNFQPNIRTLERLCKALIEGGAKAELPWMTAADAKVSDKRRNHHPGSSRAFDLREPVAV